MGRQGDTATGLRNSALMIFKFESFPVQVRFSSLKGCSPRLLVGQIALLVAIVRYLLIITVENP